MLDIKFIRQNRSLVEKAAKDKKANVDIGQLLDYDDHRRKLMQDIEELNRQRNVLAENAGDSKPSPQTIEEGKRIKSKLVETEQEFKIVEERLKELAYKVPNIPSEDTPIGIDESANKVIRQVGKKKDFDFKPLEHWQLGLDLDIIDTEKAALVSGTRFAYLKGPLALMQMALVSFGLSVVTNEITLKKIAKAAKLDVSTKPFVPVLPPIFVRTDVFAKMGRLEPKDERYYIPSDDLWLIGSAEHTLGPIHMNEILPAEQLPLRYIGYSVALRREAGSYGKDTKGIFRLHQFNKLEFESFTKPENAAAEQEFLIAIEEYLMQQLEIPYQVVLLSTGDMGMPDHRQVDIESWLPGQNRYRETHTSDYMTDFQARRLNVRYRKLDGQTEFVHMNDATCLSDRPLIAILENYQTKRGTVMVPKVLQKFMGGIKEIKKPKI